MRLAGKAALAAGIVLGSMGACCVFGLVLPMRRAHARAQQDHDAIRPGMTLREVLGATRHWWSLSGPSLSILRRSDGRLSVELEKSRIEASGPEEAAAWIEREAPAFGPDGSITLSYLAAGPGRFAFVVRFGPDGRVRDVGALSGAD
jgi:hypothetical protein